MKKKKPEKGQISALELKQRYFLTHPHVQGLDSENIHSMKVTFRITGTKTHQPVGLEHNLKMKPYAQ